MRQPPIHGRELQSTLQCRRNELSKTILASLILAALFMHGARAQSVFKHHRASLNGHRIYYEVHGEGPPLLLLHGGGDTINASFGKQLEAFAASHQVIAPEQVGHGHSPDVPGPLSYTRMADDTAKLLQHLHLTGADIVGWSDGGIIALILALHHPELVRRLVISGVNISPDGVESDAAAEPEPGTAQVDADEAAQYFPDVSIKLRHLWRRYPSHDELSPQLLHRLHKRVLVMAGDHDVIKLDHTLLIFKSLPQASLYIVPTTGHGTFQDKPEWVNPVVMAFLNRP